ncbi:MAG: sulfite exporter TauE/SafE family protein [Pelagibacteraceae bacterium]|nr:sulfite exporter TauE/SafE family protein [Pelagibacteraceae bacterium]
MTSLIIIFLITGIISGFMAGLLGVGGGIIIVPISYFVLLFLDYSPDYAMHIAIASSLGVICFTSISSIRSHIKLKNVNFIILRTWVPGIVLGSIIGSYSASIISGDILVNIFICLAFLIALNMAFQKEPIIISADLPNSKFVNLIISSLIGFLSVLIGIGGGTFSVPTLTMFSKKIHEAVGTSATLGFFIAFPGAVILIFSGTNIEGLPAFSFGYLNLAIVLLVSSTSIFTANVGAKLSVNINKVTLRRIFSIFLLFTCLSLIIEHYII